MRFNTAPSAVVPGAQRRFEIPEIAISGQTGTPTLIVVTSGLKNELYTKAMLAEEAKETQRRAADTPESTLNDLRAARRRQRRLFPRFVVVGWENVCEFGKDNEPVPVAFSIENCAALLAPEDNMVDGKKAPGIADRIFAELAAFTAKDANFIASVIGGEEVAKNS